MKYILNETPVKTTNGFLMNNISIDLDIVEKELSKINIDTEYKEEIKDNFTSKINLNSDKYRSINIRFFNFIYHLISNIFIVRVTS